MIFTFSFLLDVEEAAQFIFHEEWHYLGELYLCFLAIPKTSYVFPFHKRCVVGSRLYIGKCGPARDFTL